MPGAPPSDWRRRADRLLRRCGAATLEHPGGLLLAHLERVARILEDWRADGVLQAAGLCHACYGTDGFGVPLLTLDERSELAETIGDDAEAVVYRYASCDRTVTYPRIGAGSPLILTDRFTGLTETLTEVEAGAFLELTAANELDIVQVNPDAAASWGPGFAEFLYKADRWVSPQALEAWRQTLSRSGAAR